jgi:hypothetical protein
MGLIGRALAPKPAKMAKRALTRPAKTARQLVTPVAAKKGASRAWRVTNPAIGLRQEVEGRAVGKARRRIFGGSRSRTPASPRAGGLNPGHDVRRFTLIEAERQASLEVLRQYPGEERELEEVTIANLLYEAQLHLLQADPAAAGDGGSAAWLAANKAHGAQRLHQQQALMARMSVEAVEAVRIRAEQYAAEVMRRPADAGPQSRKDEWPVWRGSHGGALATTYVGAHVVGPDGTHGIVTEVLGSTSALVRLDDGRTVHVRPR